MKTLIAALAFTLMVPFSALADCRYGEEIDLRKSKAWAFSQLPIQNQGTYGICYAYSASLIIDYHRLNKGMVQNGQMTDPLAAAIISTAKMQEMSLEGGNVCDVIDGLKLQGYGCSEAGLASYQIGTMGADMQRYLVERVFMPYLVKQKKFEKVSGKLVDPKIRAQYEKTLTKNQKEYLTALTGAVNFFEILLQNHLIDRNLLPGKAKIAEFFQNVYLNNTWAGFEGELSFLLIRKSCVASKFAMPALKCTEYQKKDVDLLQKIDQGLSKGNPVGISICSNFLTRKNYSGANSNTYQVNSDCNMHSVAIIGKRDRSGSCEYLIRNSWGANYRYDWPTSSGDIWVNQYSLLSNTTQVQLVQ